MLTFLNQVGRQSYVIPGASFSEIDPGDVMVLSKRLSINDVKAAMISAFGSRAEKLNYKKPRWIGVECGRTKIFPNQRECKLAE